MGTEMLSSNNMKLNVTKTKEFIISFVKDPKLLDPLTVNSLPLESINTTKLLGVHLSSDLKWSTHVEAVCAKASKRLFALRSLKRIGVRLPCLAHFTAAQTQRPT